MKKIINRIKVFFRSKANGFVKFYCPGCGEWIASMKPTHTGGFTHTSCGTSWIIKIVEPDGKQENGTA